MKEVKEVVFKLSEQDLKDAKGFQDDFIKDLKNFDELNVLQQRYTNSQGALNALLTVAIRDGMIRFKRSPKPCNNITATPRTGIPEQHDPKSPEYEPDLFQVEMCYTTGNYGEIIVKRKLSRISKPDIKITSFDNGDLIFDFTNSMANESLKLEILHHLKKWWPDYVKQCANVLVDPDQLVSDYVVIVDNNYMTFERESPDHDGITYRSNYYCKMDNKFATRVGLTSDDVMRLLTNAYHRA